MVTVTSGANSGQFPFDGQTVGDAREQLADIYRINDSDVATIDNRVAGEDDLLPAGGTLVFAKSTAQKG